MAFSQVDRCLLIVDDGRLIASYKELPPGMSATSRLATCTPASFRSQARMGTAAGLDDSLRPGAIRSADNGLDSGFAATRVGDFLNTRSDARAINATIMNR